MTLLEISGHYVFTRFSIPLFTHGFDFYAELAHLLTNFLTYIQAIGQLAAKNADMALFFSDLNNMFA